MCCSNMWEKNSSGQRHKPLENGKHSNCKQTHLEPSRTEINCEQLIGFLCQSSETKRTTMPPSITHMTRRKNSTLLSIRCHYVVRFTKNMEIKIQSFKNSTLQSSKKVEVLWSSKSIFLAKPKSILSSCGTSKYVHMYNDHSEDWGRALSSLYAITLKLSVFPGGIMWLSVCTDLSVRDQEVLSWLSHQRIRPYTLMKTSHGAFLVCDYCFCSVEFDLPLPTMSMFRCVKSFQSYSK